ncbi:hypothetical protein [Aeromicrobium massiliense]|uniref:hypothetical protein n=1 Tax=Aeromicrobium massiliense TaxID=1464554 RepID=UPI000304DEFD|nr:hypothetical protein [Aeromicrobium massiliense]
MTRSSLVLSLGLSAAAMLVAAGCSAMPGAVDAASLDTSHDYDATKLAQAWDKLGDDIGAENPKVVSISVTDTTVTASATDPDAPTELNDWTVSGSKVLPSVPVDYDNNVEGLKQSVFDMDDIDPKVVAAFADEAVKRAKIEKGEVQSVLVRRDLPTSTKIQMTASVQGERDGKTVVGDDKGSVLSVD